MQVFSTVQDKLDKKWSKFDTKRHFGSKLAVPASFQNKIYSIGRMLRNYHAHIYRLYTMYI